MTTRQKEEVKGWVMEVYRDKLSLMTKPGSDGNQAANGLGDVGGIG